MYSFQGGTEPRFDLIQTSLLRLREKIAPASQQWVPVFWHVEATDGVYTTRSTPPQNDPAARCGHKLALFLGNPSDVPTVSSIDPETALGVPYPCPTATTSTVPFTVRFPGLVRLALFDLLGREVITVYDGHAEAGRHEQGFDLSAVGQGTYILRLTSAGTIRERLFIVAR